MTPEAIERLGRAARRAGITTLDWTGPEGSLRLELDPAASTGATHPARSADPLPVEAPPRGIPAPTVGIVRHRHPATGRPVCTAGERVKAGQIVGFLEAGLRLHAVIAGEPGTIGPPLQEDGTPVGYGTLLYRLD